MIPGSAKISIIAPILNNDLSAQITSVGNIFRFFADQMKPIEDGFQIEFKNAKIQDWFGWTNLLSIKKIEASHLKWYRVLYRYWMHAAIIVSEDEKLLVYHPDVSIKGANGAKKYEITLRTPKEYDKYNPFILRSRFPGDSIDDKKQFNPCSISEAPYHDGAYGYIIDTSSGTYNVDSLHACGLSKEHLAKHFPTGIEMGYR